MVTARRDEAVKESDDKVKDRVANVLKTDPAFKSVSVQSVNDGVVLLAGEVPTLSDHLRAVEHAARVPGVKRVASEIKSPDRLADNEIYNDRPSAASKAGGTMKDMWIVRRQVRLIADDRTPDVNVDTNNGT